MIPLEERDSRLFDLVRPAGWLSRLTFRYGAVGAAAAAMNLCATVVLVRAVGVERFGVIDLVRTTQSLLVGAFSLNVFQGASRLSFDSPDVDGRRRLLGGGLVAHVVAACAAGISLVAISPLGPRFIGVSLDQTTLWLAAAGIPAASIIEAFGQMAVTRTAPGRYAVVVVSQAVLTLAGTYGFVKMLGLGIQGFFLNTLLVSLVVGIGGAWLLSEQYRWCWPGGSLYRSVLFGTPYTVAGLIQYAFSLFLRVSLLRLSSPEALGWYAVAERAQVPVNLVITAAGRAWIPWLLMERPARHVSIGVQVNEISRLVLIALGGTIIFLKEALMLAGGDRYEAAYTAALLLLVSAWIYFLGDWILSGTLALAGETQHRIWIFGLAYGFAAVLAIRTISAWGSAGAALAVLSACVIIFVCMAAVTRAVHPVGYGLRSLLLKSIGLITIAVWGSTHSSLWVKIAVFAAYAVPVWYLRRFREAVNSVGPRVADIVDQP